MKVAAVGTTIGEQTVTPAVVCAQLSAAVAGDADWLWLLAPAARPRPDALACLLAGAAAEPRAWLFAGMVLDGGGEPLERELPAPARGDVSAVIRSAAQGLCPIRHATFANCLVRREAFARYGLPDTAAFADFAASHWTARVLADEPGYLCARSVVTIADRHQPHAVLATLRMIRSGVWTRGESLAALRLLR
jgi:hypothetical protein